MKFSFSYLPFKYLREISYEKFNFTYSLFNFCGKSRAKISLSHLLLQFLRKNIWKNPVVFLFYGNFARKFNFYIFHFQFQKFIQEIPRPYHIFHLLTAHLGRTNRSRNIIVQWIVIQCLIDKNYLIFWYYFITIRIINWDIWLEQKPLQINNLFLFFKNLFNF